MSNVVIYMRMSTEQQDSIESQRAAIRRYCEYNNLNIVGEFAEAESGSKLSRPQLQSALSQLGKTAEALVVYKLDRLSRSLRDMLSLLEDVFSKYRLHSVVDKVDTSTAMGEAFLQIGGVFAQLERKTIIERTKAGMQHRKNAGLTYCRRLYGYTGARREVLTQVPAEQEAIRTMQALRKSGKSFQEIADYLNAGGVPGPNEGTTQNGTPVSGTWYKATVRRILARTG